MTPDISVMSEVLSSGSLKVEDGDFVYDYIVRRMLSDSDFFSLLDFVRFDYLSDSNISEFLDLISYSPSDLNLFLFRRLRSRLVRAGKSKKNLVPSSPLKGIIAHLTESCGGNVHDHNVVTVTCSRRDNGHEDGIAGQDKSIRSPYGCYLSAQPNGALEWNRPRANSGNDLTSFPLEVGNIRSKRFLIATSMLNTHIELLRPLMAGQARSLR
jgi:hypothetical protein